MDVSRRSALLFIPGGLVAATPALARDLAGSRTPRTSAELCELLFTVSHSDFEHTGRFTTDVVARARLYDAWAWSVGKSMRTAGQIVGGAS